MGFNTGDTYEELIFDICKKKGLTKTNSCRAGASAYQADVEFEHLGKTYKLEVKNDKNPDYGQRRIHYDPSAKIWKWATKKIGRRRVFGELGQHGLPETADS
jgi:hypothetical protein